MVGVEEGVLEGESDGEEEVSARRRGTSGSGRQRVSVDGESDFAGGWEGRRRERRRVWPWALDRAEGFLFSVDPGDAGGRELGAVEGGAAFGAAGFGGVAEVVGADGAEEGGGIFWRGGHEGEFRGWEAEAGVGNSEL